MPGLVEHKYITAFQTKRKQAQTALPLNATSTSAKLCARVVEQRYSIARQAEPVLLAAKQIQTSPPPNLHNRGEGRRGWASPFLMLSLASGCPHRALPLRGLAEMARKAEVLALARVYKKWSRGSGVSSSVSVGVVGAFRSQINGFHSKRG